MVVEVKSLLIEGLLFYFKYKLLYYEDNKFINDLSLNLFDEYNNFILLFFYFKLFTI